MTTSYTIRTRPSMPALWPERKADLALIPENPVAPRLVTVAIVLALHALALWALQAGFTRPAAEIVVPVSMEAAVVITAAPEPEPAPVIAQPEPPAQQPAPPKPAVAPAKKKPETKAPVPPAPRSPLVAEQTPQPDAAPPAEDTQDTSATPQPASSRPSNEHTSLAQASNAPVAPAAPVVELPTERADYLHNPKPNYPQTSKRLGEQGVVKIRVFIDVNGQASQAVIAQSSGYFRLDEAGLKAAKSWRYVPGRRGGVPEPMWYVVPVRFELER